jgi:hypothetical protein
MKKNIVQSFCTLMQFHGVPPFAYIAYVTIYTCRNEFLFFFQEGLEWACKNIRRK